MRPLLVVALVAWAGLSSAAPARLTGPRIEQAVRELSTTAQARDKDLERRIRVIEKQLRRLQNQRNRAFRRRPEEAQCIDHERTALHHLRNYLNVERKLIERIATIDREGLPSGWHMRSDTSERLRKMAAAEKELTEKLRDAQWRKSDAVSAGKAKLLTIIDREIATYVDATASFERERALYERLLAATGSSSFQEVRESEAKAAERERDRYAARRRYLQGQPSRGDDTDSLGSLVLALGLTAAVAAILSSSDSTPEEKAQARRRLDDERWNARIACEARGGHFHEGSGTFIGTCSK